MGIFYKAECRFNRQFYNFDKDTFLKGFDPLKRNRALW